MSHEVVKTVKGHQYRYLVDSYRDAGSGKVRNRWRYLGRVEGGRTRPPSRRSGSDTRERLIGATERSLETHEYSSLTAGAIATAAGLAHGTFYRYFKDKRAALEAAIARAGETIDRAWLPLREPLGTSAAERERWRTVVRTLLEMPARRLGLMRAWHAIVVTDPEVLAQRQERRRAVLAEMTAYLTRLRESGLTNVSDIEGTAAAVQAAVYGAIHTALVEGRPPSDALRRGVVDLAERAVFPQGPTGNAG